MERYLNMKTKKDELLARITSADPAKTVSLPQVEIPKRKPSLRLRPLYIAPVAGAMAVALVLTIGNTSPLIVANADQLSEYQQAIDDFGFTDTELDTIDVPELITPETTDGGHSGLHDGLENDQIEADPFAENGENIEVIIHPRAHDFIKPGEVYRAKIAADFDSRFKLYQDLFGPETQKFTRDGLGGFIYDRRTENSWDGCSSQTEGAAIPDTFPVAIKRYAKAMGMASKDVLFDSLPIFCDTEKGPSYAGSWINIHDSLNGALLESAVTVFTDSTDSVTYAAGLISDYELMSTEELLPLMDVYRTSTTTVGPGHESFNGARFRPITSDDSKHTVAVVPMYIPIFTQNGERWYLPSYRFLYWNAQSNSALAVKSDLVKWNY